MKFSCLQGRLKDGEEFHEEPRGEVKPKGPEAGRSLGGQNRKESSVAERDGSAECLKRYGWTQTQSPTRK